MEAKDKELATLSTKTQETHRTIKRSNKLTAALANAQQTCYALKLTAPTRWNSLCDMFNNHIKAEDDIREVAREYPSKVDDATVGTNFITKMKKHTCYLNAIKNSSCELQTRFATLDECVDVCEVLDDCVQSGRGKKGDDFEHCKLEGEKCLVVNKYVSGELTIIEPFP